MAPTAMMVGLAGEHVVCADLLARGVAAYRTEQMQPYDVVADLGDRQLGLQVKTCAEARAFRQAKQRHITGYSWSMRHGKTGVRAYADGLVDGFALVALDIRRVAYCPPGRQILQIPVAGTRSTRPPRGWHEFTFDTLVEASSGV